MFYKRILFDKRITTIGTREVFSMRKLHCIEDVCVRCKYWLDLIHVFMGLTVVVVVGCRADLSVDCEMEVC